MKRKVDRCEKMLKYLIDTLNEGSTMMKSEQHEDSEYIINGKNVMRIPVSGPYSFGFQLLDMLFTKEELGKSLLYK